MIQNFQLQTMAKHLEGSEDDWEIVKKFNRMLIPMEAVIDYRDKRTIFENVSFIFIKYPIFRKRQTNGDP